MIENTRSWNAESGFATKSYQCGHKGCHKDVGSEKGWTHQTSQGSLDAYIMICPNCRKPTYFETGTGIQIPGISMGNKVDSLPENINLLWEEMRDCCSNNAYTSAVLTGRKMLMHIAVEQGASEGKSFVEYVDYLVDNHYAPPNSKEWVDSIRTHGNEANHEVIIKTKEDALEIINFIEMLLKFIYEFPAKKIKVTVS
jgi:hypothetical protein